MNDRNCIGLPAPRRPLADLRWAAPALLVLLAVAGPVPEAAAAPCLGDPAGQRATVGVVPQIPPTEIYAAWAPLLSRLGRASGHCFSLEVAASIPAFEQELRRGRLAYAYLNPYHEVLAHRWQGYVPLVRDGRTPLRGFLTVRRDSPIRTIADLNGRTVAFPSPNAFAASLLPRALLDRQGIRVTPRYVKTHSNVYRSVALGVVSAGGGIVSTWTREPAELRQQLRILWQTPGYPSHPFAARGDVPGARRDAVQRAFLELGRSPSGRVLLDAIRLPEPVEADYERDYAPLTALALDRYVVLGGD